MVDALTLPIVVIGSGLAGYTLAREFRKLDKEAPLFVVSRDHANSYYKPTLSNALAGNKTAAALVMKSAEKMADELQATVRPHAEIQRIDTVAQTVHWVSGGAPLAYRDLVLALGAEQIRPPLQGDGASSILSVNDLDDYALFLAKLEAVPRVAILGAGLIGCEFANDLLSRGIEPTLIDPAAWPLSRLLPPAAGQRLRERLAAVGTRFRFGSTASGLERVGAGYMLRLSDGSALPSDLVLSAIGLRPRVGLARDAGIGVNRGIVTNRVLATSAAHVYALGDCAEVEGHTLPYVAPILQQARALAATLSGNATPVVYPAMPVVVKTPACPTVVCPPPPSANGDWSVQESEDSVDARFTDTDGSLRGFALLGAAITQRQKLAAQVPDLLP